jgi:hypothetical protein
LPGRRTVCPFCRHQSALGAFEIAINSRPPGKGKLAPEWTDYHKRVQYQAYDVTALLDSGTNVMAVQLADGWYAGMLGGVKVSGQNAQKNNPRRNYLTTRRRTS